MQMIALTLACVLTEIVHDKLKNFMFSVYSAWKQESKEEDKLSRWSLELIDWETQTFSSFFLFRLNKLQTHSKTSVWQLTGKTELVTLEFLRKQIKRNSYDVQFNISWLSFMAWACHQSRRLIIMSRLLDGWTWRDLSKLNIVFVWNWFLVRLKLERIFLRTTNQWKEKKYRDYNYTRSPSERRNEINDRINEFY